VQRLNDRNLLIAQLDLQLTPNGLLPSQQFVIGGGQSLRGYRQNARAGDNGVRLSIENQITLQRDASGKPSLQISPFCDLGVVWNVENNPNLLQRQTFLAGVGLEAIWQPLPRLNLQLNYGLPLINLDDRGKNAQDEGFYFSVGYKL
jgi:hemolysin activation/secretion protein